jgi:hypothetical protein
MGGTTICRLDKVWVLSGIKDIPQRLVFGIFVGIS